MAVTSSGAATPGGAAGGYTGGTGNWGSGGGGSAMGGGGKGGTNTTTSTNGKNNKVKAATCRNPTITDQVFTVLCTGMKPNAVHKFYYEGVDLSDSCIPVSPKPTNVTTVRYGSPLVTDASGKIEFRFHFTVDVEKQVDATNKVKYELAGDKVFSLVATDSSARKTVPFSKHI